MKHRIITLLVTGIFPVSASAAGVDVSQFVQYIDGQCVQSGVVLQPDACKPSKSEPGKLTTTQYVFKPTAPTTSAPAVEPIVIDPAALAQSKDALRNAALNLTQGTITAGPVEPPSSGSNPTSDKPEWYKQLEAEKALEKKVQTAFDSYFSNGVPVGEIRAFAGGTIVKVDGNTATYTDATGRTFRLKKGMSVSQIAFANPGIASQWEAQYGFKSKIVAGANQAITDPSKVGPTAPNVIAPPNSIAGVQNTAEPPPANGSIVAGPAGEPAQAMPAKATKPANQVASTQNTQQATEKPEWFKQLEAEKALENKVQTAFNAYFSNGVPPGQVQAFAGGTIVKTDANTAIYTDASGRTFRLKNGMSVSQIAFANPDIAKQWEGQYGFKSKIVAGANQAITDPSKIGPSAPNVIAPPNSIAGVQNTAAPAPSVTTQVAKPAAQSPAPSSTPVKASTASSTEKPEWYKQQQAEKALESKVQTAFNAYFSNGVPPGQVQAFAGGTIVKTDANTAIYTDAGGRTFRLKNGMSVSQIAFANPDIAKQWEGQYGFKSKIVAGANAAVH